MPTFGQMVKGIEDLSVALLTGDTPGTYTDFVGVKGLSVSTTGEEDTQRGDDQVLAVIYDDKQLEVSFTGSHANPAAMGVITGSAPVTTGTTPSQITTYSEPAVAATRYVTVRGVAAGRDATDSVVRMTVLKFQATSGPNYEFSDGSWMEPEIEGRGIGRGTPAILYTLAFYEARALMTG